MSNEKNTDPNTIENNFMGEYKNNLLNHAAINIKYEIASYFNNKEYCNVYNSHKELFARGHQSLVLKLKKYPIIISVEIIVPYRIDAEVEIKTILGGSNSPLMFSSYHIRSSNYIEKLEAYIEKIINAFESYIKFIQDIQNHFESMVNIDYSVETLVDLNQYYLYLRYKDRVVVIYPTFAVLNDEIIVEAYIGNTDSHHHSMIYVNSANMEDVYSTVDFFL